jgi:hypothetical protein
MDGADFAVQPRFACGRALLLRQESVSPSFDHADHQEAKEPAIYRERRQLVLVDISHKEPNREEAGNESNDKAGCDHEQRLRRNANEPDVVLPCLNRSRVNDAAHLKRTGTHDCRPGKQK